jgi:hypothetical protein
MKVLAAGRWLAIVFIMAAWGTATARAQVPPATTSVGPGKVFCRSASACELDIGTPVSLKYQIDPAALPAADKDRLTKQCKITGTPCVATVTGTETKAGVKAASIKFYN